MSVPRCAGLDPEPKRVILREAEIIRASFVYEGERAGRSRVPGVRRDHIERGLQPGLKRVIHVSAPNLELFCSALRARNSSPLRRRLSSWSAKDPKNDNAQARPRM